MQLFGAQKKRDDFRSELNWGAIALDGLNRKSMNGWSGEPVNDLAGAATVSVDKWKN
ncbi:MAG: hypothetical protein R6W88_08885 [Desulfobacterales bacterium]